MLKRKSGGSSSKPEQQSKCFFKMVCNRKRTKPATNLVKSNSMESISDKTKKKGSGSGKSRNQMMEKPENGNDASILMTEKIEESARGNED